MIQTMSNKGVEIVLSIGAIARTGLVFEKVESNKLVVGSSTSFHSHQFEGNDVLIFDFHAAELRYAEISHAAQV